MIKTMRTLIKGSLCSLHGRNSNNIKGAVCKKKGDFEFRFGIVGRPGCHRLWE